jgi:hypothetical protein
MHFILIICFFYIYLCTQGNGSKIEHNLTLWQKKPGQYLHSLQKKNINFMKFSMSRGRNSIIKYLTYTVY